LQVGVAGTNTGVSHATDPTTISDVYFRIGGATLGTCTEAAEIDSDNVMMDNTWIWRADHGNAGTFGWTANTCKNGLVVNGSNVTALGLAVEHFQGEQVEWNGNGGETIFYQSEMPYDVPSQAAWMNGTVDGYASYNVSPSVTTHKAYGLGVYSYFNQGVDIIANSGIAAPDVTGVSFTDSASVWLNGSGQITYNIATNTPGATKNAGTVVTGPLDADPTGPSPNVSDVGSWVGTGTGGGATISNGTYTLTPECAPALRLDDEGARTTTGNGIDVYTENNTGAQNWAASDTGVAPAGYYNFATEGAYCLTASGTTSGSPAVLDPCSGTSAQAWEAVASGSYYIFHPASNTALCLDVEDASSTSGTGVQVYTCNSTNAQSWTLTVN
jgi:hypothetical protein